MSRRITILLGILAAQLVLIALLFWPRGSQATSGPLFPDFDPAQVTKITLTWEDNSLEMVKEGDGWVLPAADNFPVKTLAVTEMLTKVAQIDTRRLVADTATSHARLRVSEDNAVRRVDMAMADGTSHTLFVGSAPSARSTNVRSSESDNVYLTSALSTADVRTDDGAWVDALYLTTNADALRALALKNASGTLTLAKDGSGSWSLDGLADGETVNAENANLLANRLASLTMIKPLGKEIKPEYGLDPAAATVTLTISPTAEVSGTVSAEAAAPETVTLQVGTLDTTDNSYPVKASTSDYVVAVAAATLDPFVKYGRADLVVTPVVTETATLSPTITVTPTTTP